MVSLNLELEKILPLTQGSWLFLMHNQIDAHSHMNTAAG